MLDRCEHSDIYDYLTYMTIEPSGTSATPNPWISAGYPWPS